MHAFTVGPPLQPIKVEIVKHLLTSLLSCGEPQLPPANFSAFLVPLLTVSKSVEPSSRAWTLTR